MYTVYYLEEQLSPTGKPYVGMTNDLKVRSRQHKYRLGLDYNPILHNIKQFINPEDAFKFEQDTKEEFGWKREKRSYNDIIKGSKLGGIKGGKRGGMKNVESGHWKTLQTRENSSKGGRKVVESGQLAKIASMAVIGKKWINNGQKNKRVFPERLQEFFNQGYVEGRLINSNK